MGPRDIPLNVLATERDVILCPGGPRPVHGVPGTAPLFP